MALRNTRLDQQSQIVPVAPTTLEGVFTSIHDVSDAFGRPEKGDNLVRELRARLDVVKKALSAQEEENDKVFTPSVLSLEGLAPICTGGNWLPDIKAAAGCRDALGDRGGAKARILDWEEILSADPDVLILSPCSASPQRTLDELHLLASEPSFWRLRCVQLGSVYIIDHNRFSRPGPRLVSGVEMLTTLLRGVPPPLGAQEDWANEVLKYECSVENDDKSTGKSHCTTELAGRFRSIFPVSTPESKDSMQPPSGFKAYPITRCTIPKYPCPEPRSAHCMVSLPTDSSSERPSLLIFSGEGNGSKWLNDMWQLHLPKEGWANKRPSVNESCIWEWLGRSVSSIANEDVPSCRSNSAAVVCGSDHLLVFGGWGKDNVVTPLSACELLHLKTLCWTHCSTRDGPGNEPPPRGNPTLVYSPANHRAILFAGWDRVRRLNDLWYLDLTTWSWQQVTNATSNDQRGLHSISPKRRTDHSAVLWQKNDKEEGMIVYGGNVEGTGASGELWLLDCGAQDSEQWTWNQLRAKGPTPPGRSSHTAAIAGTGPSASMVILGGTDSLRGCAKSGIVADAWVLRNIGLAQERCWMKLPWHGHGVERCRHTMSVIGSSVFVWGGFDGEANVSDEIQVWHGCLDLGDATTVAVKNSNQSEQLQERWEAEIPLCLEDLPAEQLEKAKLSKLPNAMAKTMHRYAVSKGKDTYIDPASGYSVFTQLYLKRRPCCGNGCRHCPHGHKNVPQSKKKGQAAGDDGSCAAQDPKLDW